MTPFGNRQLAYFVTVAEMGQISRAAKALFIAQPALSQSIMRLERQLGVELLTRHPRGVALTAAGEIFFDKAKAALEAEADAAATAQLLGRLRSRVIEVGFLGAPPALIVPDVLDAFGAAQPDVHVAFRELPFPAPSTSAWLAGADVAICHRPPWHAQLEAETLWEEPRALLLPVSHRLATRRALAVADVINERFPSCHPSVDPEWMSFWSLDDHRGGPPANVSPDAPANSMELVAALTAGSAISALPLTVAQTIAAVAPRLVAVPLRDAVSAVCTLVWQLPSRNPLANAFVEAARSAVSERTPAGVAA